MNAKITIDLEEENTKRLRELGLINEKKITNLRMRQDFLELKKTYKQDDCFTKLSEKYFLSPETIKQIVYRIHFEVVVK